MRLIAHFPDTLIKPAKATVQMIDAIILRELIPNPIERELAARDAIRVSPNQRTKVTRIPNVLLKRVETENDIAKGSGSIRRQHDVIAPP